MRKKYYKNLKLIVCVGKDNLIGDRTPDENSNGMLWHIKEELIYFKNKTIGNTVLFGGTTAKYVPVELMKKNREVITLHRNMDIPKLIEDLTLQNKTIFIAGGYSIYKYFLDNFEIDEIFLSKIKDSVEVKKAVEPLYFILPSAKKVFMRSFAPLSSVVLALVRVSIQVEHVVSIGIFICSASAIFLAFATSVAIGSTSCACWAPQQLQPFIS